VAKITINGITVDPIAQAHAMTAASLIVEDAKGSDYLLIQTKGPLDADQKKSLVDLGVKLLEYVPESTYIANYKPDDLAKIRALPYVAWANSYLRGFKLAPALLTTTGELTSANLMTAAPPSNFPIHQPRLVDVVLHTGVSPDSVRDKIANAAHLSPRGLTAGNHKFRLTVQQRYLKDVAAIDEIRHIEDVVPLKLYNSEARKILAVRDNAGGPCRFLGDGQLVAIGDTGFDMGSTTDVHPAFTGRVVKLYALGRPGDASDPDGHGTHVAGSVLGDGNSPTMRGVIQGTAPKANLLLQSLLDANGDLGGIPTDLHDLFNDPYTVDGARVHTNSWGSTVGDGTYDANARELDLFVWDHRDLVVCFAAGNGGQDSSQTGHIDPGSVGAPSTAKNCITVGATENNRPAIDLHYDIFGFPANPFASDLVADNPEGMAAFSGRGLTTESRIKPDVVAPGTAILSTLSRAVASPSTDWGVSSDPAFFFDGGTSMATPLVAGSVALVREFLLKDHGNSTPSAALVKALLINGADQITGQYSPPEVGNIPDISQGFGRVNVLATVGPYDAGTTVTFQDEATLLDTNQEESISVTIPAGASQLKVTLVWTDAAGEALQNDLDLTVTTADGQERHGNVPASSSNFDRTNNVEQIVFPGPASGNATINVRAFRVTSTPAQSYALVVRIS
jgi:serine protease AprX